MAEVGQLFAAAAVDERIALLEAEDRLAGLCGGEGGGKELLLGLLGVAGELAGDLDGRAARDEVQHAGGDELVGEDEVGGLDGVVGCAGQQVWVAGAAAGEDDPAERPRRAGVAVAVTAAGAPCDVFPCGVGVGLEQAMDVFVADGGELLQGPVLADLAEPAYPPVARIFLRDELVEQCALVHGVVQLAESRGAGQSVGSIVLLDALPCLAEAAACGSQVGRQGGGDLATDARGELAAAAVGGDANLERAVAVGGEEGEGAEIGGVDDVDGDAVALAQRGDVGA